MKTQRIVATFVVTISLLLAGSVPAHAQLFGGGGLLGGGGGFGGRPMIGGGPPIGGGGFGGGPMIGGAPMVRPSFPVAQLRPAMPSAAPAPIFGGGRGPIAGGGRPIGNLPNLSPGIGNRPIVNRPIGGNLPILDRPIGGDGPLGGNRPIAGNLPKLSDRPILDRPALPGNNLRPAQPVDRNRLDDFLDNKPVASKLPERPLAGDRPVLDRVLDDRPILGNQPIVNQPIMPSLGQAVLRDEVRREMLSRRIERAIHVRDRIRHLYYRENHPFTYWWSYMWTKHPVWSWWHVTTPYRWANWSSVSSWCRYRGSYSQPVMYEYTDQGVYADGKQVNVDDKYSQQARELAAAGKNLLQQKIDAQEADKLEWLPLGVFALCKSDQGDPTMFLQLAISREGIIAGSFANTTNNENLSVQGGADRESTRLAVTIGDQDDVVVETGLYNVTEQQSSAMVHYQDGTRENWLLVKMPDPQEKQASNAE